MLGDDVRPTLVVPIEWLRAHPFGADSLMALTLLLLVETSMYGPPA